MKEENARFEEVDTALAPDNEQWRPVIVRRDEIEAEALRLGALDARADGLRESRIVHSRSDVRGLGLAPGIEVRLSVLLPGERTTVRRHNATEVNFCIAGTGVTEIAGRKVDFKRYDVWNHPGWTPYVHSNPGSEPQIRLTYSNAPLLRMLNVYQTDEAVPAAERPEDETDDSSDTASRNPFGTFALADGSARLMPYETLISPPAVPSPVLHWPWLEVKEHLDKLTALGSKYRGRRLYLLYNERTGNTNGTTPSFFATMCVRPPGIVDRPHRHVSASINYYFSGAGYSTVAGERYEWAAGDLMLSAPGWAVHNHASKEEGPVYELTIQDQPYHIHLESLLWQEELRNPPILLGTETGFSTNRGEVQ